MDTLKFGKKVVKYRVAILVFSVLLLAPSLLGMLKTRINYDMLTYLPEDMETVIGQDILLEDFGKGAFSFLVLEDMKASEVAELKAEIQKVEHVDTVLWYDSLLDISVPVEMLPDRIYEAFNKGNATMLAVFFNTSTSSDDTMEAVQNIRKLADERCYVTGMSAMVADLKELCEKEEPIYVALAVLCSTLIMMVFMDNYLAPIVFLLSMGMAILWNLGSNYFLGEISYLTKALSAVLQLAVTMDYSIFLWHSYSEERERGGDRYDAMARAIKATVSSVVGSSVTTIAGFLALCFMSFLLGRDMGVVMAKGVLLGVIGCVTTLPALILVLEPLLKKTSHRPLFPQMKKLSAWIVNHAYLWLLLMLLLVGPFFYGYQKTNDEVYYDMGQCLPEDMDYVIANTKLQDTFGMGATHMLLVRADLSSGEVKEMMGELEQVDGISYVLGLESVVGSMVPEELLPESLLSVVRSENWQLLLLSSQYQVATDEVSEQIEAIGKIVKKYDAGSMLIGEAPCTKDMIDVTDHDFKVVSAISIISIFIIIVLVLKSGSLPLLLVSVIEFAIFINLGLPHFTGTSLPFVAPICVSTIQLGATVDYAILMTTRYKRERMEGREKKDAVTVALATSVNSILVSGMGFFAATFGVALYSDVDLIRSMCNLMARGALVSMVTVILALPALLLIFDTAICKTTLGLRALKQNKERGRKHENVME